jgi:hypothetical protein
MKRENTMAVQHIIDWSSGEAYFAIVQGSQVLKRLHTSSWAEAAAALKAFKAAR